MGDYDDINKIRRVLRQLRSRLQALSTAAVTAPSSAAALLRGHHGINHPETPNPTKISSWQPLKHTYKRGVNSQNHSNTLGLSSAAATSIAHYDSPVRRPVLALRDTFHDLTERVYLDCFPRPDDGQKKPMASTNHNTRSVRNKMSQQRPVARPVASLPSLAHLAAFSVGSLAVHDDAPVDDEGWYEEIPNHLRRQVSML